MELRSFHAIFLIPWSKTVGSASPIVFSIDIDSVLQKLQDSGLGCDVGRTLQVHSAMRMILTSIPYFSVGCVRWFQL